MKFKELKNKSEYELHRLLQESKVKLQDLRFKIASKQFKNIREMRAIKKTIARLLTIARTRAQVKAAKVVGKDAAIKPDNQ